MTTVTVHVPAQVAVPRGARWAGALFSAVSGGWVLWREARRQRKAAATRAAEAAEVRALATQLMNEDRRFAADLLAAADRHERS